MTLVKKILVNDGIRHRIEILIDGKANKLIIDDIEPQTIVNSGIINDFELKSKNNLYLGGLPKNISVKAIDNFHIVSNISLQG